MAVDLHFIKQSIFTLSKISIFLLVLVFVSNGYAMVDRYPFKSPEDEDRYQELLLSMRCTVCQNQSLAESNASLADELRQEIHKEILNGKSDADIKSYLVERYGPTVLYEPPLQTNTLLLWLGPLLLNDDWIRPMVLENS